MDSSEVLTPEEREKELLSYLYTKQFHCIVCDKDFMDFMVRSSKLRVSHIDTDFRKTYKGIDPTHYEVLFCCHCGYATLHPYFDKIIERQQKMIAETISSNFKPREFAMPLSMEDVLYRYNQAILCCDAINAKASQKAFICLKLAWIWRGEGNKQEELKYLKIAFDGLKEAFSTERFPLGSMDEPTAKYVIADLARRLSEPGEAMRWVGDVVIGKGIPGALKERALNLKDLIREGKIN